MRRRRVVRALLLATAVCGTAEIARSQVNGTWIGGSKSRHWSDTLNWSSHPQYPGDGGVAVLPVTSNLFKFEALSVDVPVTLSGITFDTPNAPTVTGAFTLVGPCEIRVNRDFVRTPSVGTYGQGPIIDASLHGNSGMVKTGPGVLHLTTANSFTGRISVAEGDVVVGDSLGDPANIISLDGGNLQVWATGESSIAHPLSLSAAHGAIAVLYHAGGRATWSGEISGAGGLDIDRRLMSIGTVELSAANTYTGLTRVLCPTSTLAISPTGTIRNTSSIELSGPMVLRGGAGAAADRLGSGTVHLRGGGQLTLLGSPDAASISSAGTLALASGLSAVNFELGAADQNIRLTASGLTRSASVGQAIIFRSATLGQTPGPGVANLFLQNVPEMVGGGGALGSTTINILPGAIHQVSSGTASCSAVTYDPATGVRPLTAGEQTATMPSGVTRENVRLRGGYSVVSEETTINSLVLDLKATIPATVAGTATLHISSGLLAGSGSVAGNSNVIDTPIDFGTAPGVIAGTGIRLKEIHGSGGLILAAERNYNTLSGISDYTGPTTIAGSVEFWGSVLPGVPGPFGADSTPIIFEPSMFGAGSATLRYRHVGAGSTVTFARDLFIRQASHDAEFASITSTSTLTISGSLHLEGRTGINSPGGLISVIGPISGPGGLYVRGGLLNLNSATTSFAGGVDIREGGTLRVGSDHALGTGTLWFSAGSGALPTLEAVGGPRTLANPLTAFGTISFSGQHDITITGETSLASGGSIIVNSGLKVSLMGPVLGQDLTKYGDGTLELGSANAYVGSTTVFGGMLVLGHGQALGPAFSGITLPNGYSALGLRGGITVSAEALTLLGDGPGGLGALRSLDGINTWAGPATFTGSTSIGVDSGTLVMTGTLSIKDSSNLIKLGPGTLTLGTIPGSRPRVSEGTLALVPVTFRTPAARVQAITLDPGARLDLTNRSLIVSDDVAEPYRAALRSGYAGGAWNGPGIMTSFHERPGHALGSATAGELFSSLPAYFRGWSIWNSTTFLIRYTWYGDANLDGKVDVEDLGRLAAHWQSAGFWAGGDFNYDGLVNVADLGLLAGNWQQGITAASPSPSFPAALAALGLPAPGIPEPATWLIAALLYPLRRRWRSRDACRHG